MELSAGKLQASMRLHMTPAGRATYALVADEHARVSAALLRGAAPADIAACLRVFDGVEHALATETPAGYGGG